MKVVDAIGAQLDWMVAKCMGYVEQGVYGTPEIRDGGIYLHYCDVVLNDCYSPATNWAQAGPIIDRERITIRQWTGMPIIHAYMPHDGAPWGAGPTPLIAAMRCFCCSKLGREVEVPDELLERTTP